MAHGRAIGLGAGMIDWRHVQASLSGRGWNPGPIDGVAGSRSYAALFAFAATRPPDAVLVAIGQAAARHLKAYGIDATPPRLAEFVAQTCNETGGYRRFVEDLDYSAPAICRTWPDRFPTLADAEGCAHAPEMLANRVYARPAMGNVAPGDGWRFRGRGMLQLTFRANYAEFQRLSGLPLVEQPDLAADPAASLLIACYFWRRGRVNDAVDADDFVRARRITNGGSIGLEAVARLRTRLRMLLVS